MLYIIYIMPNSDKLYYIDQKLTKLPNIPNDCTELYCGFNQIEELPKLPQSLKILHCNNNQIKELPPIPNNCMDLDCSYNQITKLEKLPINLNILNCSNNQITELPRTSPENSPENSNNFLKTLNCSNNQITKLPTYSNYYDLVNIYCAGNKIETIKLNRRIQVIDISFNADLKTLDISEVIGDFQLKLDINQFDKFYEDISSKKAKIFIYIYIPIGTNKTFYKKFYEKIADRLSGKETLEIVKTKKSTLGFRGARIIENYNITNFSNNIKKNIITKYNLGNSYKIASRIEGGSKTVKNSKNPKKINMKKSELQKIALKNKVSLKKRDGTMKKKDELIKSLKLKKLL